MDDRKKEGFIRRYGKEQKPSYQKMAKEPPAPPKPVDGDKKLEFVHKMTHLALSHTQHLDAGGSVLAPRGGPIIPGSSANLLGGPTTSGAIGNAVNPQNNGIAGSINSALGTNNTFQAAAAPIQAGTNAGQLNTAYTGTQGALAGANNLAGTLTPGVAQGANSQSQLTSELSNEAAGGGPNPAQAALNQNTATNVANQAALMAGQRGASSNAGLIAREAAQQGAATQQQAVGQEATQAATQQLNAQSALAGVAANQVNQGTNATELQNQTQQNEQNILQGANTATNSANVASQSNINNVNAAVAAGNQNAAQGTIGGLGGAVNYGGGLLSSIGSGLASIFAKGGIVPPHIEKMAKLYHPHKYAEGGMAWQNSTPAVFNAGSPQSATLPGYQPSTSTASSSGDNYDEGYEQAQTDTNSLPQNQPGGQNFVGPLPPIPVESDALGGTVGSRLKSGGKVPGKPKVQHDAYKNDTVSAKLTPGEVVIDLDTLKDQGPLGHMARAVAQAIMKKKGRRAS